MKDLRQWVTEIKSTAGQLTATAFLESVASELRSETKMFQGEACLELAEALRVKAISVRDAAAAPSEYIAGLLRIAEEKLGDDPLPTMQLATHFFYDSGDAAAAYPHAIRAFEKSKQQQVLVRQSAGELIRICLALQRHSEIEAILGYLTQYTRRLVRLRLRLNLTFSEICLLMQLVLLCCRRIRTS